MIKGYVAIGLVMFGLMAASATPPTPGTAMFCVGAFVTAYFLSRHPKID